MTTIKKLTIMGVVVGSVLALAVAVWAADLHVPGDYPTIQAAVAAASPGDKIEVDVGIYNEHVTVTKSIEIKGNEGAVVDGGGTGDCFFVLADHVTIKGFTLRNAQYGIWFAGDYNEFSHNTIYNINWVNNWDDGGIGIVAWDITDGLWDMGRGPSDYNTISHNEIYNCNRGGILVMAADFVDFVDTGEQGYS